MSPAEAAFIQAGVELRERRVTERDRRRRRTILALAGGLVVALILVLVTVQQRRNALVQASIGLASQALSELEGISPERSVLLALEALESYPYTWQAERALAQAVLGSRLRAILQHEAEVNSARWSPDGTRILTASDDARPRSGTQAAGRNF